MDENLQDFEEKYDITTAASWIIGHAKRTGVPHLTESFLQKSAFECTDEEKCQIIAAALWADLKLYPFKSGKRELARIRKTMGFLRSVTFESLLDVGSGRGVFLIPFIREFSCVRVKSIDLLEKRVEFLNELSDGGFYNLQAEMRNICDMPYPDNSFDVVTMLEVLEHIPNVEKAISSAVKTAKKYVVVTVPSKPDDNPEHIHLLTKDKLTDMFESAGCNKLRFDNVEGHLFMIAQE